MLPQSESEEDPGAELPESDDPEEDYDPLGLRQQDLPASKAQAAKPNSKVSKGKKGSRTVSKAQEVRNRRGTSQDK